MSDQIRKTDVPGASDPELRQLIKNLENTLGSDHPKVADALCTLADLMATRGQTGKAEPLYWQALEIRTRYFGADTLETARTVHDLAVVSEMARNYDESERLYRWCLNTYKETLGLEHRETKEVLECLRRILAAAGRPDETIEQLSVSSNRRLSAPAFLTFPWKENVDRGKRALEAGDLEEAERIFMFLRTAAEAIAPGTLEHAQCLSLLAESMSAAENHVEQLEHLQEALSIYEECLGADHPELAKCMAAIGRVQAATGQNDEATHVITWAVDQLEKSGDKHNKTVQILKSDLLNLLPPPDSASAALKNSTQNTRPSATPAVTYPAASSAPATTPPAQTVTPDPGPSAKEIIGNGNGHAHDKVTQAAPAADVDVMNDPTVPTMIKAVHEKVNAFLWEKYMDSGRRALTEKNFAEAEHALSVAVEKARNCGFEDQRLWRSINLLGMAYLMLKKIDQAEMLFNEACSLCEESMGTESAEQLPYLKQLVNCFIIRGERERELACYEKMLHIMQTNNAAESDIAPIQEKLAKQA